MRLGMPLKYQIWLTGAASWMWPMRSRRTLERVTSTPHLSQILFLSLNLMRLYLPQWHSQSLVGPKMRSQIKAVALGLEGAVVDGFGLGYLAVAPLQNLLGGRHADLDGIKVCQVKQNAALPFGLSGGNGSLAVLGLIVFIIQVDGGQIVVAQIHVEVIQLVVHAEIDLHIVLGGFGLPVRSCAAAG